MVLSKVRTMEDEQQPQAHSRRSYVYESQGGRKNKKKLFAIIGGILIIIIVLIVAISAFSSDEEPEEEDIFATPAITQSPTDTPAPTPEDEDSASEEDADTDEDDSDSDIDRSEYTILIQNGSGTAGAAGRLSDILGDLGYTVGGTENADNFDYTETEISVANGNNALLELLESDLSDEYTIGDTSTNYDGDEDAVIIIGAE